MDIKKLTPAPWLIDPYSDCETTAIFTQAAGGSTVCLIQHDPPWTLETQPDDAEFIALARNAFDVMMRRGWIAIYDEVGKLWSVHGDDLPISLDPGWLTACVQADPYTALVEADKWYVANVEAKEGGQ